METVRGEIWEGILPGVLRKLYVGRRTGVLSFVRGDDRCALRFRQGHILGAETSIHGHRLGEMLVRQGRLSRADLERALESMARDGRRLGAVLLDTGLLDSTALEAAIATHTHEVLGQLFSWADGSYEFVDESLDKVLDADITLRLSTGELILQAARGVRDPDVVRYNLGDIDRVLVVSSDPLLRYQRISLGPVDGYVLSRVDGRLNAREVVRLTPLPSDDVQRSLFGLLSTGVLQYLGDEPERGTTVEPPPPDRPPADEPPPTQVWPSLGELGESPDEPDADEPPPTQVWPTAGELGASSLSPGGPLAAPRLAPVETHRLEILEAYDRLDRTHFEVLGVPREATEAQVREAYFRLARRFHPDVHHDQALSDLRDKLEQVFARLGEAYEVLCSPRMRARYERGLAGQEGTAAPGGASSDAQGDAERTAEAIRQGKDSLAQERYWEAIRLLEPAILRAQGPLRQEARVLLARAYAKNPGWVKQGEEMLLAVLREQPENVDAWLQLGRIYSGQGLRHRAFTALRRALELQPGHEEARGLLAGLGTEGAPSLADSRRLLAKIFGPRKGQA